MNAPIGTKREALQVFEPAAGQRYSLEAAAHLAGVRRRTILFYCRSGLIEPYVDPSFGGLYFDDQDLQLIRRAESLRAAEGMSISGVRLVFQLLGEIEGLRQELRFLRGT